MGAGFGDASAPPAPSCRLLPPPAGSCCLALPHDAVSSAVPPRVCDVALHLHRAARTDRLADALASLLAVPGDDPFAEELVVVPARGVERWLAQRLSHRLGVGPRGGDGVCAGVRFTSPSSLSAQLLDRAEDDPWTPDRLVWPLLAVLDAVLGEPWAAVLARHLGAGRSGVEAELRLGRRYAVARRLAGLFAAYASQRPALVTDWREGRDTDGAGAPLPDDLAWQPELYRRLLGHAALADAAPPDVRLAQACERLATGTVPRLPGRLSLFGHTRLTASDVALVRATAQRRDVHLWLPHPSPGLWARLAAEGEVNAGAVRRSDDATAAVHPLLASLARDTRELQRTLAGAGARDEPVPDGAAPGPGTLLGWLQADLAADVEPDAATRASRVLAADDRSVQVHACHGATRQVDVLREVLVGLLADDPTLEPRDVLVMCPDVDAYAPLIAAGFGLADVAEPEAGGHPAHRLRVRLADRGLGWTNPLLAVAASVVAIAGGRATATEVRDLAAAEPVRRRFGFSDDDLGQVAAWAEAAAVRWGLDAPARSEYQLDGFEENTWRAGLDRVLLGVAMAAEEHRSLGPALPVDDVASNTVDLAGRLAEMCDRLTRLCERLRGEAPVAQWVQVLGEGLAGLTDVAPDDVWQVAELDRELARIADAGVAGGPAGGPLLRLADVRTLLAHRLEGRPTRANFRTGTLTVCTMVPMRSVPHRVVCLLGLDDGAFPRNPAVDGDDALARDPLTGERDVRSEDRQLFCDAVLAARETLVVTYTGANEYSGQARPPAVPLGELLDVLDVTATTQTGRAVTEQVRTQHPLQPFDERNFAPGALVGPAAFSFDGAARAGAAAARTPSPRPARFLPSPLVLPRPRPDLALEDLARFLLDPVATFLRRSLGARVPRPEEERRDAIPLELDALERWGVGDRLLRAVVEGRDPHFARHAERLRGTLPPGPLGEKVVDGVLAEIVDLYRVAMEHLGEQPRTVPVEAVLGDGRRLLGSVSGVHGNRLLRVGYSRLGPQHRLRTWVELVAVSAAHPDASWTGHAIGRGKVAPVESVLRPPGADAPALLEALVDLYDRGMAEPVPMPLRTASAWACARGQDHADPTDADRDRAARRAWEPDDFAFTTESEEPAHVMVHGPRSPLAVLTEPARDEERWGDAPHRLGQYAARLWGPLLERESER